MLRYLLYPGVILHEFLHYTFCFLLGVKVKEIKFGLKESYVKHDNANTLYITLIALAPLLGIFFGILFILTANRFFKFDKYYFFFFNWLAISFIYYSIPSNHDISNILTKMEKDIKRLMKGIKIILGVLYSIFIYLPTYVLTYFILLFNNFEALRIILIFFIYLVFA